MTEPPVTGLTWLLATAPVLLLFAAVLVRRLPPHVAAAMVLAIAALIGATAFRAGADVLLIAAGKGAWLGIWILAVVWPALLLAGVTGAGGLERIGRLFTQILPRRRDVLLLLAWVFPSFLQGVAGFGTPIAVCAPLLVAAGWSPVRSVVYPLIGYHWSVTFGSMGSSFYMAALTAHLGPGDQARFALLAAALLAGQCLLAGALVLWLDGGVAAVRHGVLPLLGVGAAMGVTLVVVAQVVPAVASLAAGTAGVAGILLASAPSRRRSPHPAVVGGSADTAPDSGAPLPPVPLTPLGALQALSPYLLLLVTALPVFLVPSTRDWVREHLLLAPGFPASQTGRGWENAPVADYTPIALLGHPGFYVVVAALLGYVLYRLSGIIPSWHAGIARRWARSLPKSTLSILALAMLATVMADTGMVSVLASGVAAVTGDFFPALSPLVGGLGSFMTGSTTTSNALFAGLQVEIAQRVGAAPTLLLAAQTAGGNIGNALAPVVIVIGLTTVGRPGEVGAVIRRCLPAAAVLFGFNALATLLLL